MLWQSVVIVAPDEATKVQQNAESSVLRRVVFDCLVTSLIFSPLPSAEWHSDSQDPQVHDEPAASKEANGKVLNSSAIMSWFFFFPPRQIFTCSLPIPLCRLSMSCIRARPRYPRLKSGRNLPRCTRPPLMSCSCLASGLSLAAARQQALPWCTTP